jgi:hypothetical protein
MQKYLELETWQSVRLFEIVFTQLGTAQAFAARYLMW